MALLTRENPKNVIIHSDKGSQYCSNLFRESIRRNNLNQSMSGVGACYDNAACESFFHSLKVECVHNEVFNNEHEAKVAVINYIESYYNRTRMHSYNQYIPPLEFEKSVKIR